MLTVLSKILLQCKHFDNSNFDTDTYELSKCTSSKIKVKHPTTTVFSLNKYKINCTYNSTKNYTSYKNLPNSKKYDSNNSKWLNNQSQKTLPTKFTNSLLAENNEIKYQSKAAQTIIVDKHISMPNKKIDISNHNLSKEDVVNRSTEPIFNIPNKKYVCKQNNTLNKIQHPSQIPLKNKFDALSNINVDTVKKTWNNW